uniref:Uncharacterized protein n=1 Tax=Cacopsylla melanoneura TaxID=428564 RepID=A0A8D8Q9T4_9HEMI
MYLLSVSVFRSSGEEFHPLSLSSEPLSHRPPIASIILVQAKLLHSDQEAGLPAPVRAGGHALSALLVVFAAPRAHDRCDPSRRHILIKTGLRGTYPGTDKRLERRTTNNAGTITQDVARPTTERTCHF